MASVCDLCGEGDILFKHRGILARRECDTRARLVHGLADRCAVAPKVTVAAIDRLDRMASCTQARCAQLRTIACQRNATQRSCTVIECDASGRCMAPVRYMSSEGDILFECGGVQARRDCHG